MIAMLRIEFYKQLRRTRTLVTFLVMLALPLLIVAATKAREHRTAGDNARRGGRLFTLAKQSGILMPAVTLEIMSFLFLLIVAAMFAGDAISGEASSGNLRYVLLRPVSRVKLVASKLIVALVLTWAATFTIAIAALGFGVAFFGWHSVVLPGGLFGTSAVTVGVGTLLSHLLTATLYVAFGMTAAVAIGIFVSTLTDSPAAAIGATVGAYIVSSIVDSIDPLGVLRYGLPTHYSDVWSTMFTANTTSHDIVAGVAVQCVWLAVFASLALWWFSRKDIKS